MADCIRIATEDGALLIWPTSIVLITEDSECVVVHRFGNVADMLLGSASIAGAIEIEDRERIQREADIAVEARVIEACRLKVKRRKRRQQDEDFLLL